MIYAKLTQSDIEVSMMGMGCWALGGGAIWGEQAEQSSIETVSAALDNGINLFDTAPAYGKGVSEQVLGKALKGRRDKAVIADKVSRLSLAPDDVALACETSLKRLQTDYIDIYQLHWPNHNIPLADTIEAMQKLKDQGKIRAIGVSNFGVVDMSDLLQKSTVVSNQLPYNLLFRAIEFSIIDKCADNGIGIMCYCPLQQGLLAGKFSNIHDFPDERARTRHFSKTRRLAMHEEEGCEKETFEVVSNIRKICRAVSEPMAKVSLAWLLYQRSVVSVLAGARTPQQVIDNVSAIDLELSEDVIGQLNSVTEGIKSRLGPNPDMWRTESRFR